MTASHGADADTTCVRPGFDLDERALMGWMTDHVSDFEGPLELRQFKGGQSNPTYKLVTPGRDYVLRRKPPGLLLNGAHAVEREARVLTALGAAGYPVAHVHGLCTDDAVIGTWFYVMEMVTGRIFWDATFPGVTTSARPAYFDAMNAALANLHSLDPAMIALGDFGKPGNYYAKQIHRWTRQYQEDVEAGRDPMLDRLIDWLSCNIPEDDRTTVVHGDFRCDNMIFHAVEPRILAVLDWELSTLGHPLADFANHAVMYRMPPHIVAGMAGADLSALNIPAERDYVAAYCRRAGLDDGDYAYAVAFAFFRLAAIFHGIKGRVLRGTAASAHSRERVAVLPELISLAWDQAKLAGAR